MKKGIKKRLVSSYLLLIIFTVVLFETIILSALYLYYQNGVKQILRDQGSMFASFYEQELIEATFEENAEQMLQNYSFSVHVKVQLLNQNGKLIAETHKSTEKNNMKLLEDVKEALNGEVSYWLGPIKDENVLIVSYPLMTGNLDQIGIIRFTSSMEQLNDVFYNNVMILLGIGAIVIVFAVIVSFFLAKTITKPVRQITNVAEQMAAGKFYIRIPKENDDEIGQLAETMNYMAEQIEKHEQLKNEFIASVSHDLRTPLTSIKGWAVTLYELSEDGCSKEGLEIISNETDRLTSLVTDLLDFSSLASGKMSLIFEEISLSHLIEQVIQQLRPRANRQKINLIMNTDGTVGNVTADMNRMKQVFLNLLDNALKFTSIGGTIIISLEKKENLAMIRIRDTGIGISKKELKTVKEKFYKGKTKGAGTGLGLSICEEIIRLHNGSFELESEAGVGTTAIITLPL